MPEAAKNQPTFHINQVGNINTGDITIEGDQIDTQHNYAPQPSVDKALIEPSTSQPTIIYDQRGATIGNIAYTVQGNQVTNPAAPDSTSPRETSDDAKT